MPEDIPGLEKREAGESTLDDIMDEMTVLKSQLNELKLMSTGRGRSPSDCNTMKVMMKEVMHAEQVPIIIAVVKDEVEKGVTKIAGNVKEQVDAKTKLWTDLFNKKSVNDKDMFDSALMKAATEHTKKTSIAISDEGHQKDERSRNIVIRGVPESESTVNEERYAHDIKFLVAEAGMLKTDIVRCYRVGSKNPDKRKEREKNGKSPHRALIVEFPSMDSVMSHTNNGSGFKFEIERDGETEVYWINKDLTPAQQLAGFRARSVEEGLDSRCNRECNDKDTFRNIGCSENLKLFYTNCCSIINKLDEVRVSIELYEPDFLCICETHLTTLVDDAELFIAGYRFFRKDRDFRPGKDSQGVSSATDKCVDLDPGKCVSPDISGGGGCIIYYKEHLNPDIVDSFKVGDCLALKIECDIGNVIIACVYRSPSLSQAQNKHLLGKIKRLSLDCSH